MELEQFLTEYKTILTDNINIVEDIIRKTDEYYGMIGERLPIIEEEINDTLDETDLLINHFIRVGKANGDRDSSSGYNEDANIMINIFRELHSNIKIVRDSIKTDKNVKNVLSSFVSSEGKKENLFIVITDLSNKLSKVLNSLHVLSINASIYSFRQGDQGSGISVISQKIGVLSQSTKAEFNSLTEYIDELRDWYNEFQKSLKSLYQKESNANDKLLKIDENFNSMMKSLNMIAKLLKQSMDNIKDTVEPFYDILILLQNQDIIRQNLENVIKIFKKTVNEIDNFGGLSTKDEHINSIVFMYKSARLSLELVSNIQEELDSYLIKINDKINKISSELKDIQNDQEYLTSFIVGENRDTDNDLISIKLIYNEVETMVPEINSSIHNILEKQNNITKKKEKFLKILKELEQKVSDISSNAENLDKIKFLSKIEFARIDRSSHYLDNIGNYIDHFTQVSQNQNDVYNDLKESLEKQWDEFTNIIYLNNESLNKNSQAIKEIEEKIYFTRKIITETVHNLNQSIDNLSREIATTQIEMKECNEILGESNVVAASLSRIARKSGEFKERYLSKYNYTDWQISSEHLQGILSSFTSYVERDIAQKEFSDHDIDTGSQGGELTLF